MLQTKQASKIVVLKEYQLTYEQKSETNTTNITVCNMETMDRYMFMGYKFANINLKGFEAAIMGKMGDFGVTVQEIGNKDKDGDGEKGKEKDKQEEKQKEKNKEKGRELVITIKYSPAFLVKVEEKIVLPYKDKLNQLQFFLSKAQKIQQGIRTLTQKSIPLTKISKVIAQKQFKGQYNQFGQYDQGMGGDSQAYDMKLFESINLPEYVRYYIEVSMYLNCTANYYYFYTDRVNYTSVFPSGAMMVPVNNQYVPIKFGYIFDNSTAKSKEHAFYAYDVADYPFKFKNLVITATKME